MTGGRTWCPLAMVQVKSDRNILTIQIFYRTIEIILRRLCLLGAFLRKWKETRIFKAAAKSFVCFLKEDFEVCYVSYKM